ncbi:phosphomannomutase/phosphoglucomutase [Eionea flava]
MKPIKNISSQRPIWQQAIVVFLVACLSAGIAYYLSWLWIAHPESEQRFSQIVERNVEEYSQKTQAYLTRLNNTLSEFSDSVPESLLLPSQNISTADNSLSAQISTGVAGVTELPETDAQTSQQWLNEKTPEWQGLLPEAIDFKIFSHQEIETMTSSLRFGREEIASTLVEYGVSFLFLDMVNRLNDGQVVYTEVAKVPGTHQWQLHHVTAIDNSINNTQGILYTVLTIDGLYKSWGMVNTLFGHIMLQQKVDQRAPLSFFNIGQASNNLDTVTVDIPQSYWQITYKPSKELRRSQKLIPLRVWIITTISFLLVICIGGIPLLRSYGSSKVAEELQRAAKNKNSDVSTKPLSSKSIKNIDVAVDHTTLTAEHAVTENVSEASGVIVPSSIFRAYDIRGIAYEELSLDLVYAIGQAYATEVLQAGDTTVVVGWDARMHSQEFSVCLIEGIHSTGCHTLPIGVVPTPLMNFTAQECDATSSGIIITASHNPKEYNGCKMVIKGRTLVDEDIQRLKNHITSGEAQKNTAEKGQSITIDLSQKYIDKIVGDVAVIDGWRVVVDTANGASSELAPRLFNALQCQTHSLFGEFDGAFPNHDPDPSVEKNLQSLIEGVKEKQADIGFALDGDGDRIVAITGSGNIMWPDQLMMLFAQDIVARNPGCDVVFDIKCTQLLAQTISEHGGRPVMWKTGHSHIKAKMKETGALLGGEFSGHIFFKERWYGFDDGLYAAARLLEIMTLTGKTADELLAELPTRLSTPEIKIPVAEDKKFEVIEKLISTATFSNGQKITIDGLRVDFADGWGLVRASNTAPALTLRFEAENQESLDAIKQQFSQALSSVDDNLCTDF